MKCACGYKYETDDWGLSVISGDEPFIKKDLKLMQNERINNDNSLIITYSTFEIFICPKCSTIKAGSMK